MSSRSAIEWTDATWSPFAGCRPVSPGCKNCYAARVALRLQGAGVEGFEDVVRSTPEGPRWTGRVNQRRVETINDPIRWKRARRIFVNSQSDTFHENASDEDIARVFAIMAMAHWHTFQVLTKRAKRMRELLSLPVFRQYVQAVAEVALGAAPAWPLDIANERIRGAVAGLDSSAALAGQSGLFS